VSDDRELERQQREREELARRQAEAEELRRLREAEAQEALKGMLGDKDRRETGGPDNE
jgi:hypothetical protein